MLRLKLLCIGLTMPIFLWANDTIYDTSEQSFNIDSLWVLLCAILVFLMQAGFKTLETGLVKSEHRTGVGAKNLMDMVAGMLGFFLLGYGFMFGDSLYGIIGFNTDLFAGGDLTKSGIGIPGIVFFLFQVAFAGTALTIVSGAMSGRTGLLPYLIGSLITAIIIYPVFGHWAWGNILDPTNHAWLAEIGFMDFAGSTVVHTLGATVGLVGIILVGPRLGRFDMNGKILPIKASDYSYSILGVILLWVGWWGFNGGSTLTFGNDVYTIILNTNVAGAASCFSAFIFCYFFQDRTELIEKMAGGALTGLVAITACCNVVSPSSALIIGLLAGIIHNLSFDLILKVLKFDDPVGAIPVHGFGGIFGTLCVALFGKEELLMLPRWEQLLVQAIGVEVCIAFTVLVSFIMFKTIKSLYGLRVSPEQELGGMMAGRKMPKDFYEKEGEKKIQYASIKVSGKGYNLINIKNFIDLSKSYRDGLIQNERVAFIDAGGEKVNIEESLRQLSVLKESSLKNEPLMHA